MTSPRALPPPSGDFVLVTQNLAEQALEASRKSGRLRMILPFHKTHEDSLHRMFNAVQPGTYVRPHRHVAVPKAEVFILLRGALDFMVFDDAGRITHAARLKAGTETFGADVAPGLYHAFLVREPDTLIYEVKPGPYSATTDKDFAPWAPAEDAPEVAAYVMTLERELRDGFALR